MKVLYYILSALIMSASVEKIEAIRMYGIEPNYESSFGHSFGHSGFDPFQFVSNFFRNVAPSSSMSHSRGFPADMFDVDESPFIPFIPWYQGPNVCPTVNIIRKERRIKELDDDEFPISIHSSSEHCRGNNEKYVCIKRIFTPEGPKVQIKKYMCCPGYVRRFDGRPGCVRSAYGQTAYGQTAYGQTAYGQTVLGKTVPTQGETSRYGQTVLRKTVPVQGETSRYGQTVFGKTFPIQSETSIYGQTVFGKTVPIQDETSRYGHIVFGKTVPTQGETSRIFHEITTPYKEDSKKTIVDKTVSVQTGSVEADSEDTVDQPEPEQASSSQPTFLPTIADKTASEQIASVEADSEDTVDQIESEQASSFQLTPAPLVHEKKNDNVIE